MMKTCTKGLHQYEPVKGSKKGCEKCRKATAKRLSTKNKAKKAAASRRHYERNRERIAAAARAWAAANPDRCKEIGRRYYAENKDKAKATTKKWRDEHPDKVKSTTIKYREAHRENNRDSVKRWIAKNPLRNCLMAQLLHLPVHAIPLELIEAKRANLMLKRLIKESKNGKAI